MKIFKISIALFFCSAIAACSHTKHLSVNTTDGHYYAKDFNHTQFSTYHKGSHKKPTSSDRQLMQSLLNRPIPEDQRMMLAFAKRQENYYPDSAIVGIKIIGEKDNNDTKQQNVSIYADLIVNDINSVSISAMPK
ncbi:hypothetical protein AADZ84_09775 [Colwelliaceae bacterium MEBiC 14330]